MYDTALFYSRAQASVLVTYVCVFTILDAWYDRVSFTRETSTMLDYLEMGFVQYTHFFTLAMRFIRRSRVLFYYYMSRVASHT